MKKIFTLLTALFAVMTVNAQTWDIAKWETADVTGETTIDGLTYYGEAKSAYAAGNKTFEDGKEWTGRVKMGGASTFKAGAMSRVFSFEGKKGNTVKVYAVHGSSSGDDRTVYVSQNPTDTKNDVANTFGKVATVAAAESPKVLTATIPEDGIVYVWADNNVGVYAIIMETGGDEPVGDVEKFEAVTFNGETYVAADVFANAVIADGKSIVTFGTANMDVTAVGGTTAKDVYQDAGTEFAGWTEWNDVKWDLKSQGDIFFGYIVGTGNPAMEFTAEEVLDEGTRTGHYRPSYTFYTPDCGKMPVMGLYYKFTAKAAGDLKIYVWSNKGNRNTYLVDEATTKPVAYKAEGYINGQNDESGAKKWLSSEEIAALSTPEKPYVIGAGNQPFWGAVNYSMSAGQTVWLFQDSSQIGFQGYEFSVTSGIEEIVAAPAAAKVVKTIKNGKIIIMNGNNVYNVAGQLVK